MSLKEQHGIKGRLTILLRNKDGKVVEERRVNNIITNAGKNLVANYFTGGIQAVPELYIAVGNKDTKADPTDIVLGDFLEEAEANTEVDEGTATVTATLPAKGGEGENQELREAGILIHVQGQEPVLYNRVTFPVVNKSGNMEMTLTWEVIF